ncbi:proline/glycine betaine ABC transporter permease ProW [Corticibacter populi]|uniref:Proline/glycine betaine ABC transporter permease ProW n=1 Tax=Corticibacter populi TaxID=1550736 RepID=A0A3M6R0A0_9BURK|nr:glycine betaine/L-proline ABC transporter permease ProW [Corticibacter populi]RMX08631.1 proline/glycine betaine ABC transporter permease ProW [Corticibacter populi]RZS35963.1 glycine betaine/proline transport system permease protein [Corticibacter populi]
MTDTTHTTLLAQNTVATDNPWATTAAPPAAAAESSGAASNGSNPWATAGSAPAEAPASTPADNPWGGSAGATPDAAGAGSNDWLSAGSSATPVNEGFQINQLWDGSLPIQSWINDGLAWFVASFRPFFQAVRTPIDATLGGIQDALLAVPTLGMIGLLTLLAWQFAGRGVAIGSLISLLVVAMLGVWPEAMITLALVLTSLVFCMLIGLPLGIVLASSDRAQRIARPILDAMQTTPAFVYLVPVVMLFGIGNVPGVIVTIVFALPPLVRLTNLGIRQVRPDLIEAAKAYGASPMQMLAKVQLPLAMPSIMAGINQALMLSLSMVVIASMIAVGGLGQMVLRGIGRLDMGLATVGGLGIVLLAIMLDRITQAMGQPKRGGQSWRDNGPLGLLRRLQAPKPAAGPAKANTADAAEAAPRAGQKQAGTARQPVAADPGHAQQA